MILKKRAIVACPFSDTVILGYFKRRGGCFNWTRDPLLPAICEYTDTSIRIFLHQSNH